jgi:hypothetical protein
MSDTVKLIIEIPKETYKGIMLGKWDDNGLAFYVKTGTLLDNVLDEIDEEIEQLPTNTRTNWDGCCPDIDYPQVEYVDVTKNKLLSIIDKYKAESEVNK